MYFEALKKKDCIEYLLDVLLYALLSERVQFIFFGNPVWNGWPVS